VTFAPRKGAFVALIGFPLFLALRIVGEVIFGQQMDLAHDLLWAALMTATFAAIATFTKYPS
jgi:hypothetical protein